MSDDYQHLASGRIYREGDPAHRFAQLVGVLNRQCEEFSWHWQTRLSGRDYLEQHTTWPSDPERIARAIAHTIDAIDKAYTAVVVNRDLPDYGLGKQDDEWRRKYGEIVASPNRPIK